jgi:hypothetical protein
LIKKVPITWHAFIHDCICVICATGSAEGSDHSPK